MNRALVLPLLFAAAPAWADQWNSTNNPSRFDISFDYIYNNSLTKTVERPDDSSFDLSYSGSIGKVFEPDPEPWTPSQMVEYVTTGGTDDLFASLSGTKAPTMSSDGTLSWTELQDAVDACPLRKACDEQEDMGDDEFYLVLDEDADGQGQELYLGLCQAWVAASILEPEPVLSVKIDGTEMSGDSKDGIIAAAYSTTFAVTSGMQCSLVDGSDEQSPNADDALGKTAEKVSCSEVDVDEDGFLNDPGDWGAISQMIEVDEDGFIQEIGCVDSNPGTFHVLVTNIIGKQGSSFVVDRSPFDTVWLAPIASYEQTAEKELAYEDLDGVLDEIGWAMLDHDAARYVYVEATVTYVDTTQKAGTSEQALAYVLELDKNDEIGGGTWAAGSLDRAPDFFMLPLAPAAEIEGLDLDRVRTLAALAAAGMDADGDGLSDSVYDLSDLVCSLGLHGGTENSLLASADAAVSSADAGDADTAANQLEAFVNKVEAQEGKKIDLDDATTLIGFADNAILAL